MAGNKCRDVCSRLGTTARRDNLASLCRGLWPTSAPCRPVLRASSSRSGQFQHIVGTADQTPLTRDLRQASQQELSEATRLFDLTKHRFDHLLP